MRGRKSERERAREREREKEREREREREREGEREKEERKRQAKKVRARRRYDIARCKLQFCCEIIIKYIMPSRLLPHNSPLLPLPRFSLLLPSVPPDGGPMRN